MKEGKMGKYYVDTYLKTKEDPRELIVVKDNFYAWGINPLHPYWYDRFAKFSRYKFSDEDLDEITEKEAKTILKKWGVSLTNCPIYDEEDLVSN